MVQYDNTKLTTEQRGYPWRDGLMELVTEVSKVRPLFDFMLDSECVTKDWNKNKQLPNGGTGGYDERIYRVKVVQDGEVLGALHSTTRYARNVGSEQVYGIESFRINKERGNSNTTYTKDMKVALRAVKKCMVGRANEELIGHLKNNVINGMRDLHNTLTGSVRYGMNIHAEAMNYVLRAYEAHTQGKTEVSMPIKPMSVNDLDEHHRRMEQLMNITKLNMMYEGKEGYCIHVQPDERIVCHSLADGSVHKHASIDELPKDVAEKFAMFKIITEDEPYYHLGVKLKNNFFFIAQ